MYTLIGFIIGILIFIFIIKPILELQEKKKALSDMFDKTWISPGEFGNIENGFGYGINQQHNHAASQTREIKWVN